MLIEGNLIAGNLNGTRIYSMPEFNLIEHYIPRFDKDYIASDELLAHSGMYILLGNISQFSAPNVYVGETMNVQRRLKEHLTHKDFWQTALVFQLKEEQFNSAQIAYLEYLCIKDLMEYGNVMLLENCQIPNKPYMNSRDEKEITEIFNKIKILIGYSGLYFFDNRQIDLSDGYNTGYNRRNIANRVAKSYIANNDYDSDDTVIDDDCDEIVTYTLSSPNYYAEAIPSGDRYMILPIGRIKKRSYSELIKLPNDVLEGIDHLSGNIKKDIYFDTLDDFVYAVTGQSDLSLIKESRKFI